MHPHAMAYIAETARQYGPFDSVLELGGRDVNGSPRPLFPAADYVSVDIAPGSGVDVVADATTWRTAQEFDVVVCAEVLEHVPNPEAFIRTAWCALRVGGRLILTMATDHRAPHSASDGGPLRPGEWYQNVNPESLKAWLFDFDDVQIEPWLDRGDLYASALREG